MKVGDLIDCLTVLCARHGEDVPVVLIMGDEVGKLHTAEVSVFDGKPEIQLSS